MEASARGSAVNEHVIYKARNFTVRSATFVRPGAAEERELIYIDQPPVAIAIPLLADGKIVMAEQWRPLVGDVLLECPGGKVEKNESPEEALRRELSEEIGLAPGKIRKLGDFFSSVGASTEHIFFFVASELIQVKRRPEDKQKIKLVYLTEDEARGRLRRAMFPDGKTRLALLTYFSEVDMGASNAPTSDA
jgi:ADP-ribose pyrophosphatase